jgi:hypothetical protein
MGCAEEKARPTIWSIIEAALQGEWERRRGLREII